VSAGDPIRVLIVEDDVHHAEALEQTLGRAYEVRRAGGVDEALAELKRRPADLVVTDLMLGGRRGTEVLEAAKRIDPDTEVMLISGYGSIEDAVESMHSGAAYYFTKPLNVEHVRRVVAEAASRIRARRKAPPASGRNAPITAGAAGPAPEFTEIVATTPPMMRLFELVTQIAPSNATVLIMGENGTGKELVARAVHGLSPRRDKPFVALNCAALSEGVLESELFGHEKGAFTGAQNAREGRFEFADKGTLFLDEVGDMPLSVQVKLLRVLQEREITRVGSNFPIKVDVRLVAATNKDLETEVRKGTFREDLYYRLRVLKIVVPPLRERRPDIPHLIERFIAEFARRHDRPITGIEPEALRILTQHDWPGNVRELQNVMETMVLLAKGPRLTLGDVPEELAERKKTGTALVAADALEGMTLKRVERELIRLNLDRFEGNRAKVAKSLGISERTLYRKLKEYGMT
jgi:two-component system, NtrC family, response regulator HydG